MLNRFLEIGSPPVFLARVMYSSHTSLLGELHTAYQEKPNIGG